MVGKAYAWELFECGDGVNKFGFEGILGVEHFIA